MRMLLAVVLALTAHVAHAEFLRWSLEFQGEFTLADPSTFADTQADVYHLVVDNPNVENVYTYSLDLTGGPFFVSTQSVGTGFPMLGPFTVADSFLVRNAGAPSGAVNPIGIVDTESRLSGTVTVLAADPTNGNAPVPDADRIAIAGGKSAVLAVLAVPAGTGSVIDFKYVIGTAVVGGDLEVITLIPEPSTALLVGLAAVGLASRRR